MRAPTGSVILSKRSERRISPRLLPSEGRRPECALAQGASHGNTAARPHPFAFFFPLAPSGAFEQRFNRPSRGSNAKDGGLRAFGFPGLAPGARVQSPLPGLVRFRAPRRGEACLARALAALALVAVMSAGCQEVSPETAGGAPPVVTTKGGVAMVRLPGGWFIMGSAARGQTDEPPHRVFVSPFDIDACEVTQAEYEKVAGRNPSRWKGGANPVEQIRWADAARYCNARSHLDGLRPAYDEKTWACDFSADGYRLPTEAEWEYACRAGSRTQFCFGDSPAALAEVAWFKDTGDRGPHPVGQKRPNAWGIFDMHGNVWEWCNDFYGEEYYASSPERDPAGPPKGTSRVLRGGCWNSRADLCRSAYRNEEDPGYTDTCFGRDIHGFVGFRCVRRPGAGHEAPGRTQS